MTEEFDCGRSLRRHAMIGIALGPCWSAGSGDGPPPRASRAPWSRPVQWWSAPTSRKSSITETELQIL